MLLPVNAQSVAFSQRSNTDKISSAYRPLVNGVPRVSFGEYKFRWRSRLLSEYIFSRLSHLLSCPFEVKCTAILGYKSLYTSWLRPWQWSKGATTGGSGVRTPKIWTDHPNFFDEECDYRYVTDCSARNWVYHPYFVLYNNLDQEIGPPTLKTWLRPWAELHA